MTTTTYWTISPRGFANEYKIAVATDEAHATLYRDRDWDRITRKTALRLARARGDAATEMWIAIEIDDVPLDCADGPEADMMLAALCG